MNARERTCAPARFTSACEHPWVPVICRERSSDLTDARQNVLQALTGAHMRSQAFIAGAREMTRALPGLRKPPRVFNGA